MACSGDRAPRLELASMEERRASEGVLVILHFEWV
jgi:hypothetical protein